VQQYNYQNCDLNQGAPENMTFISAKLKSAGYSTHHVGKHDNDQTNTLDPAPHLPDLSSWFAAKS